MHFRNATYICAINTNMYGFPYMPVPYIVRLH